VRVDAAKRYLRGGLLWRWPRARRSVLVASFVLSAAITVFFVVAVGYILLSP
jgi:hypothetical protein